MRFHNLFTSFASLFRFHSCTQCMLFRIKFETLFAMSLLFSKPSSLPFYMCSTSNAIDIFAIDYICTPSPSPSPSLYCLKLSHCTRDMFDTHTRKHTHISVHFTFQLIFYINTFCISSKPNLFTLLSNIKYGQWSSGMVFTLCLASKCENG